MRPLFLAPLLCLTAAVPAPERSFMITGFERLRVEGPFDVEVVRGSPRAVASGDRRALEQIAVRVEGGTMVVNTGALGWEARQGTATGLPKLRVSGPALRSVTVNGGGRVRIAEMRGARVDVLLNGAGALDVAAVKAEALHASLTGTGAVTLAGNVVRARINNRGAGSIDASGLSAGDAELLSDSSGELRIEVRYTARATALGSGAIQIGGKPECRLRGPGPIACAGTIRR